MEKMIIYKEWLKTRALIWGMLAVTVLLTAFCFLNLQKNVQFQGEELLWNMLTMKDTVLVEMLRYLPAILGGILALCQFLPETRAKRLKLTLHLPYPQGRMIGGIYLFGLCVLSVLFLLQALSLWAILSRWIVPELISRVMLTVLVWYLAGYGTYIWVGAICIEPTWKMRVVMGIVLVGILYLLFLSQVPEAYNSFLPYLTLYVLFGQVLFFSSTARFKEGLQD